MSGIHDLSELIRKLNPVLCDQRYVFFCNIKATYGDFCELEPICVFQEAEGLTVVVEKSVAEANNIEFETVFRKITLSVYSDLEAVGLTKVVSEVLAEAGISCNVIAAFHHDHLFIPAKDADHAFKCLKSLADHY